MYGDTVHMESVHLDKPGAWTCYALAEKDPGYDWQCSEPIFLRIIAPGANSDNGIVVGKLKEYDERTLRGPTLQRSNAAIQGEPH